MENFHALNLYSFHIEHQRSMNSLAFIEYEQHKKHIKSIFHLNLIQIESKEKEGKN